MCSYTFIFSAPLPVGASGVSPSLLFSFPPLICICRLRLLCLASPVCIHMLGLWCRQTLGSLACLLDLLLSEKTQETPRMGWGRWDWAGPKTSPGVCRQARQWFCQTLDACLGRSTTYWAEPWNSNEGIGKMGLSKATISSPGVCRQAWTAKIHHLYLYKLMPRNSIVTYVNSILRFGIWK